jgi:hypothetical protein
MPLPKPSEKGRRVLQRSPSEHPKVLFVLRKLAESTLGTLLVPLFGQFLQRLSNKYYTHANFLTISRLIAA